ncbi:ihibitor of apoptosis 2 (iap-2) [Trichoplusia ni single nucleopolyhedrovirus]|uniref:Ihibitor of apoptosis 2 (Iap-2) n=1 Tax=Trichoplusia ni single nucleopolyhedrovirus TaxID=332054 RepID=Q462A7_9ABAC|nr:ihibitor of apoptosis 2 (iap-2) [Trichoplusia ni single nucleopolyhedrovirus]AAZ67429.1 ihibitor of apoptosis 2 (iap-2) [Trichoplusia ni single nucleopolyhedrovirus]
MDYYSNIMNSRLAPPSFYHEYNNRIESFAGSTLTREYKQNLAKFGIYYEGGNGVYKCAFCPLVLVRLDMRTLKYHTFSTCSMATTILATNETLRKESFRKFKAGRRIFKENGNFLAVNGFYYYGKSIEIRCAGCRLTIVKLNRTDRVEDIHRKYSPECQFNNKPSAPPASDSDTEIDALHVNIEENDCDDSDRVTPKIYPVLDLVKNNNVSVDDKNDNNDDVNSFFGSNRVADSNKYTQSVSTAVGEDDRFCKICFENERNTCFLPCKHVSTCADCARKCKVCCICRMKIKERLEVYLQ